MDFALENIAAQGPAFYHKLTAAVEDVIAAIPVNTGMDYAKRCRFIANYMNDSPQWNAVVKLLQTQFGYPNLSFAIEAATEINLYMYYGYNVPKSFKGTQSFSENATLLRIIADLTKHLNADTGVQSSGSHKQFTTSGAVTAAVFVIGEYNAVRLTAAEIAAGILHEMGHVYYCVSRLVRGLEFSNTADMLNWYQPKSFTKEDALLVLDESDKLMRAVAEVTRDASFSKNKQLKELRAYVEGNDPDPKALQAVVRLVCALTSESTSAVVSGPWFFLGQRRAATLSPMESMTQEERQADTFAARYGAAAGLATMLEKFTEINLTIADPHQTKIDFTKPYRALQQAVIPLLTLGTVFGATPWLAGGLYDPPIKRIEEIIRSCYAAFKDPNLSPDVRSYYISQIEIIEGYLSAWKKNSSLAQQQKVYDGISLLLRRGAAAFFLFMDDYEHVYDKISHFARDYIDNPLFYQAARIKQLTSNH